MKSLYKFYIYCILSVLCIISTVPIFISSEQDVIMLLPIPLLCAIFFSAFAFENIQQYQKEELFKDEYK